MSDADDDMTNVDELFKTLQIICEGEPARDVMYVVAMMVAHGIAKQSTDKDPDSTFTLLREVVDLELRKYKPQLAGKNLDLLREEVQRWKSLEQHFKETVR